MRRLILGCALGVLAAVAQANQGNSVNSLLTPYFGNTFISLHDDGTQYIVLWNADGTFSLTRRGGPDPAAGYTMHGTYTIDGSRSCFHPTKPVKGAPMCVPVERGKAAGTVWEVNGRVHEVHMIIRGRRSPSK